MSLETAKKTVDLIFQSPSKSIVIEFQGGEPLLKFDIIEYILDYAKEKNKSCQKNLTFRLVTNLTMMTDDIMEYFVKEEVGLCTSLDGPAIVHNKNRGEYEKVVSWVKKIKKEYAPHNLNAMMLITKNSLPYHKEIIDEYLKLGFNTVWVKPANQLGYAAKNKEESICTADEFLNFWKKSLEYLLIVNKKVLLKEYFTTLLLKKIFQNKEIIYTDLQSPCGAAINQLAYNYDGNVYTCDEGRQYDTFKLGTVDNTYSEMLTSRDVFGVVMISMNDSLVCDRCVYKPYCGVCPACNYAETGNTLTKFPNRRCEIMKGMFDYVFEKLMTDNEYKKMFLNWAGL
jgi:His-Xaa-Ser system radical SAM maturase HxsB